MKISCFHEMVLIAILFMSSPSFGQNKDKYSYPINTECQTLCDLRLSEVISASGDMLIWNMGYKNMFAETMII
jgi:hypothetical protein